MLFTLGGRTYDLATRSLVIARLRLLPHDADADVVAAARRLVDEGADVIEVAEPGQVAALNAALDVPIGIATDGLDAVRAAYQAGAVLGSCPDPAFLALSDEAGATVITSDPARALEAGLPADRIAIKVPAGTRPPEPTHHPLLITAGGDTVAAAALAITYGVRLIRTTDVHAARRVADVLAAILEAGR